jgi:hypothetical protein
MKFFVTNIQINLKIWECSFSTDSVELLIVLNGKKNSSWTEK